MVKATTTFNNAQELEAFIDSEMQRTGWLEMVGIDGRDRAHCIECADISFVDWTTNSIIYSVYAPEFDY